MQTERLAAEFDAFFHYRAYPDGIVDLLAALDRRAPGLYEPGYLRKETGLLLRLGERAEAIYCASFPSADLVDELERRQVSNALLVLKHPMDWEELGAGFVPLAAPLLTLLQERAISVYCAHAAHDNLERGSPSAELARALPLDSPQIRQPLHDSQGRIFGYLVEGRQPLSYDRFRHALAGRFGLLRLQERQGQGGVRRVAAVAGGGDNAQWLRTAVDLACDTYVTGIQAFSGSEYARQHNPAFLAALRDTRLHAFGLSHYLSEFGGSRALAGLLGSLTGLPADFLPETSKLQQIIRKWGQTL